MSTWLKLLPLELQEIQDYAEPKQELSPNDDYVGEMSIDLKKLFTLLRSSQKALAAAIVEAQFGDVQAGKVRELRQKAKAIEDIFWISVKDEHSLWEKERVGVRRGFRVVWSEPEPLTGLDIIRSIFGD